ncbi:MAG: Mut7-C RNAse domain-containing protein [Terriglobia bacterium]
MTPSEIRFAVDRMLGRLARMLRLLGYDTYYANDMTAAQLLALGRSGERVILTRGETAQRFPHLDKVLSLKSEYPPQQLREVVERLGLDTRSGLWTRCTLCNAPIERVQKAGVEALVEAKIFQLYEDFYRCTGCGHVYWHGSHVDRILRNLEFVLGRSSL